MENQSEFYDTLWIHTGDMKEYGPVSRHLRRLVRNITRGLEYESVLDVGCGEGTLLREILRWGPVREAVGVDLSKEALALAREKSPAEFQVLDIEREHLDRQFDLVVCTEVLEHLPKDEAALRHIRAMTRRYLVITVPQGVVTQADRQVGHVRGYSVGIMEARLRNAGFVPLTMWQWGFPFYSPLYRRIIDRSPSGIRHGTYGLPRRVLASFLYWLFMLNLRRRGDKLIVLAAPAATGRSRRSGPRPPEQLRRSST